MVSLQLLIVNMGRTLQEGSQSDVSSEAGEVECWKWNCW